MNLGELSFISKFVELIYGSSFGGVWVNKIY
jgi:hypothetical protein